MRSDWDFKDGVKNEGLCLAMREVQPATLAESTKESITLKEVGSTMAYSTDVFNNMLTKMMVRENGSERG